MRLTPIRSEKSTKLAESGRYTLRVPLSANRAQVGTAVKKMFAVQVVAVRTAVIPGKKYRTGKKGRPSVKPDWKKAIVTLAKGQKLDIYGGA